MRDAVATAEVVFSLGQSEAQAIAMGMETEARLEFARGFCAAMLAIWWGRRAQAAGCDPQVRKPVVPPLRAYTGLAERTGGSLATLSGPRAGYLAGQLYTALLPDSVRKALGAYYTSPPLVDRLLALITESGFDWSRGRVLDPACGGAAFLASVAPKLVAESPFRSPTDVLADIEARLLGLEVDVFAAWMSMVLLDLALLDLVVAAQRRPRPLVLARDALRIPAQELGQFDLVLGNPPYGRVRLEPELRGRFRASLFGHANLYGLFTELAVRLAKPDGLVALVAPTSFLGGEYFKNLRRLLVALAPLRLLDFVGDREGVFDGVLQETLLAVFARRGSPGPVTVRVRAVSSFDTNEPLTVEPVGTIRLNDTQGGPWLLPRSRHQLALVRRLSAMPHRLQDYGFAVSTGQLVWNRHKAQLRAEYDEGCYPIIWAEAVNAEGTFCFQAARRSHLPYLKVREKQDWLINHEPCLLLQRTTAKEQKRRLIAAVIPNSFVLEYPGFVVENHLNMLYCLAKRPPVALRTLAALLNSAVLDQAFRCINGSVAVSAYELNSLPLPSPDQMELFQELVLSGASSLEIDDRLTTFYTTTHEFNASATTRHAPRDDREVAA